MLGLLLATGLIAGVVALGLLLVVALFARLAFWVLFWPIRLLFHLVLLPFLLVKWVFRLLIGLLILPIAGLGMMIGVGGLMFVALLLLLLPLVPFLILGMLIWLIVRAASRPALPAVHS